MTQHTNKRGGCSGGGDDEEDIPLMVNSDKTLLGTNDLLPVLNSPLDQNMQQSMRTSSTIRSMSTDLTTQNDTVRWQNLPKDVWKPVSEVIKL